MILTDDGTCNYVSPDGKVCSQRINYGPHRPRHWFTLHAMEELKLIESNDLDMARARIITTEARKLVASKYIARCPFCETVRGVYFARKESLIIHMNRCVEIENKRRTADRKISASEWVDSNMPEYDRGEFKNEYEAAIWRLMHAEENSSQVLVT
jgi:hypothetical protein